MATIKLKILSVGENVEQTLELAYIASGYCKIHSYVGNHLSIYYKVKHTLINTTQ